MNYKILWLSACMLVLFACKAKKIAVETVAETESPSPTTEVVEESLMDEDAIRMTFGEMEEVGEMEEPPRVVVANEPDIMDFLYVDEKPVAINKDELVEKIGYPEEAKKNGISGTVVARILIDEEGKYVKHKIITKVHPSLIESVEKYVPEIRYSPAKVGEKAIMYWVNESFFFE